MIAQQTLIRSALVAGTALTQLALGNPVRAQVDHPPVGEAALVERLNRLEAANQALQTEVDQLKAQIPAHAEPSRSQAAPVIPAAATGSAAAAEGEYAAPAAQLDLVGTSSAYSARMLDHNQWTNSKNLLALQAAQDGAVPHRLTLGGSVIALADWQYSNRASKFGWLMRQPTANNQVGNHVSEVAISSAQIALTARPASFVTAYAELLYNPETSFGAGTNTAIGRNVVTVTRAFVTMGDLHRSPFYLSLGKLEVPFGQNDSVNPYSNSSNWHAFGGLANEAMVGYFGHGLSLRAALIEGGAQFRAANTVVSGTNVPSLANNFALDASYTVGWDGGSLKLGGSYLRGSDYCSGYPIAHFLNCVVNNPAVAGYTRLEFGRLTVLGDYAITADPWPGTAPQSLPGYAANPYAGMPASKVSARTVGLRYRPALARDAIDLSLEFSNFTSGVNSAPWHRQNQWVGGLAWHIAPTVKLFGEALLTQGYAPLNFLTGGNGAGACGASTCPATSPVPYYLSWTDSSARSNIGLLGVEAAF